MMHGYLGIDIGTTNTKLLVVGQNGSLLTSASEKTPVVTINGLVYFDLARIEAIVDGFLQLAARACDIKSVGFSTVGESVVPIKGGKAIHPPLMWNEARALDTPQEISYLNYESRFGISGRHPNNLYTINKILWMTRNLHLGKVELWLPLSSYFVYRKTGVALWDYSQANRTYVYDTHQRCWNTKILEHFNLEEFAPIRMMGTACGEADGITYGLGGHDHIVGLFGLKSISGTASPFFYDSMGTSCLLALLVQGSGDKFGGDRTFSPQGGGIGGGFEDDEYIITRSFRFYGRALEQLMSWARLTANDETFASLNQRILAEFPTEVAARFSIDGDFLSGNHASTHMQIQDLKIGSSFEQLMLSMYAYLGTISRVMVDDLNRFHQIGDIPYFAAGRATANRLLITLKASALEHPITIVNTPDLSALGAVVVGMQAAKQVQPLESMNNTLLRREIIEPHPQYSAFMSRTRALYLNDK
jgi:sugar (pentulose or hexulose) kinase